MNIYEYKQGAGYPFHIPPNSGVSSDAREIDKKLKSVSNSARGTISLGDRRDKALVALLRVYKDARADDWAGQGSLGITVKTFYNAFRFINALPLNVPIPEINAEPDGHVAFEWRHAPYRVISVSVGEKNELPYAALVAENRISGRAIFRDALPDVISESIKRVYSANQ